MKARGEQYLGWAQSLDAPGGGRKPAPRPEPKPPLEARPKRLSVTEIEHWLRDPYTIYAKHVLRLRPLDAVDTPPGAADRGSVIHDAIGEFTKRFAASCRPIRSVNCWRSAKRASRRSRIIPEAQAFWWPRFKRIARWFAGWERERRPAARRRPRRNLAASCAIPLGDPALHADGARRPHRAAAGRQLRHRRLQDRRAAERPAGPRAAWRRN